MFSIEKTLNYEFKNKKLLETALTHTSYANEKGGGASNERLEFFGDSLLGFLVAKELYLRHPEKTEGELTRLRAGFVCESNLAGLAERLSLTESLLMGKGEDAGGGRSRPSIACDAVEALLAALYFDGGLEQAESFVSGYILSRPPAEAAEDAKTALQERSQREKKEAPVYKLIGETGPDHRKIFSVEAYVGGVLFGKGEGCSKKLAEQEAARQALKAWKNLSPRKNDDS